MFSVPFIWCSSCSKNQTPRIFRGVFLSLQSTPADRYPGRQTILLHFCTKNINKPEEKYHFIRTFHSFKNYAVRYWFLFIYLKYKRTKYSAENWSFFFNTHIVQFSFLYNTRLIIFINELIHRWKKKIPALKKGSF